MTTTLKDTTAKSLSDLFNARKLEDALSWAAGNGQIETVLFLLDRFGESFSEEELRKAHSAAVFKNFPTKGQNPDAALLLEWQIKHNRAVAASVATPPPEPGAP